MDIGEHWLAAGVIAILALMGVTGEGDYQEELNQEAHYCKMVMLYKLSNGNAGWPDYEKKRDACQAQDD
tara:strand:- start:96 stop:302 length:207 start_codon:yes stop_codon:yes gene_type:complete